MKNVFGYPEFDAEGEEILCTYDNAYSDMPVSYTHLTLPTSDLV